MRHARLICTCGHVYSSHRQETVAPFMEERCKTCGCAAFNNRDDDSMQSEDEYDDAATRPAEDASHES